MDKKIIADEQEMLFGQDEQNINNHAAGNKLRQWILIAVFASLIYVSLAVIFIPVGPMFVHVGNLIVVTAALLMGGWQGGLAGSIGMGLFDLLNGHVDSTPKTIVLKFVIGVVVGAVYVWGKKRQKFPKIAITSSAVVLLIISVGITLHSFITKDFISHKVVILSVAVGALGLLFLGFVFLGTKLPKDTAFAFIAAIMGMAVNLTGETVYKFFYYQWLSGFGAKEALITAIAAQSSTTINAVLAVVGGVSLFLVTQKHFDRLQNKSQSQ